MIPRKITEGIQWIGAVDWDRRLFDSLIPLPDGTSYNAYLIQGNDKTVLVDSVDPSMTHILMSQLEKVPRIDYVISHHAEQDHSGAIGKVVEKYPEAKVVCTKKAKVMLIDLLLLPEDRFKTVEDSETVDIGGRILKFIHTPWVHWPETMVTWLEEDKILFSCDFFGSHIATTDLYVTDEGRVYEAAKRYFSEIMMPFRTIIADNLKKLEPYDIKMIAPSHGPIYDKPSFIIDAYKDWVLSEPRNLVVIPYVSMHSSTRKMIDYLVPALAERGIEVQQFDLAVSDIGKLAMSLVDAATIIVGTPTVIGGPHPLAVYGTYLANLLRPKVKFLSVIGSYGWGTKAVETLAGMIGNLKVDVINPVIIKGVPKEEDFKSLDKLADAVAAKHREAGILP
ncbi:FprA family A-type flavoprotein [candidate division WOR-3 bacterium]|nr:FprA family A-type flavoprotein [candidate division WOR-3 bacterium]